MLQLLDRHIETFLLSWRREVRRALWRVVHAGLVAGATFVLVGGLALTLCIVLLGQRPLSPLGLVSYVMLLVAGVATGIAATGLAFSAGIVRAIEHGARTVVTEARRVEAGLAHTPEPASPRHR
jgi:hypothetical protein